MIYYLHLSPIQNVLKPAWEKRYILQEIYIQLLLSPVEIIFCMDVNRWQIKFTLFRDAFCMIELLSYFWIVSQISVTQPGGAPVYLEIILGVPSGLRVKDRVKSTTERTVRKLCRAWQITKEIGRIMKSSWRK